MIPLNTENIHTLRSYLLANSEQEQLAAQKNIAEQGLSDAFLLLQQYFDAGLSAPTNLTAIANTIGAQAELDALQTLQSDYYSHLAGLHLSGVAHASIDQLMKVQQADFLQEIQYQQDLKTAFLFQERASLKKTFQQQDAAAQINDEDLGLSFKLTERQQLKQQFQAMANDHIDATAMPLPTLQKANRFHLRRWAIAASIVGIIGCAAYALLLQLSPSATPPLAETANSSAPLFGLSGAQFETSQTYGIQQEKGLQLNGATPDSITLLTRDVVAMEEVVHFKIAFLAQSKKQSAAQQQQVMDSLTAVQKKLLQLNDSYSYDAAQKNITLHARAVDALRLLQLSAVHSLDKGLYLQLDDAFYKMEPNAIAQPLQKVSDKKTIELLNKF